jgi:hypothetical protein
MHDMPLAEGVLALIEDARRRQAFARVVPRGARHAVRQRVAPLEGRLAS